PCRANMRLHGSPSPFQGRYQNTPFTGLLYAPCSGLKERERLAGGVLVRDEDRAESGLEHGGDDRRLVQAPRGDDDPRDGTQRLERGRDHAAAERMVDGVPVGIEKPAHDVADGTRPDEILRADIGRQPVADLQRAVAHVADADERDIDGGDSLEGLTEDVLLEDGR